MATTRLYGSDLGTLSDKPFPLDGRIEPRRRFSCLLVFQMTYNPRDAKGRPHP